MDVSSSLPKDFLHSLDAVLGLERKNFMEALGEPPPTSVRFNPGKKDQHPWKENARVPWAAEGYYLDSRPSFIDDPVFFQGKYYVQEASSMVIGQLAAEINKKSPILRVLDLCAAPGGKSTDLLSSLPQLELMVSNELVQKRTYGLKENLVKWGHSNAIITHTRSESFSVISEEFDLILVDAPCSGEGMFRKDPFAISQWTPGLRAQCASTQKNILEQVWPSLKEGGHLIYSTCTLNKEENEQVLIHHQQNHVFRSREMSFLEKLGILPFKWKAMGKNGFTYRFLPHKIQGEGFTVSVVQKTAKSSKGRRIKKVRAQNQWAPEKISSKDSFLAGYEDNLYSNNGVVHALSPALKSFLDNYAEQLNQQWAGPELGRMGPKGFIPGHDLALQIGFQGAALHSLDRDQCLKYLRRLIIPYESETQGWLLMGFENFPLGWAKVQNGQLKSHYPQENKIRKPEAS